MRIGVDVGGTHTDAVILNGTDLIAEHKAATSADIETGVIEAVRAVLAQSGLQPSAIDMITIGTTQFTNAVVERRGLARAAVIRIGKQSSSSLPIAAKWPGDLSDMAIGPADMVDGGHDYDGTQIIETDAAALTQALQAAKRAGVESLALISVFSTSTPEAELAAAAQAREMMPGWHISLSHELGRLGLYQRENATILNAALMPLADKVVSAFQAAFEALALTCPLFLSQNDGTLMAAPYARRYPVFTFSSGPTNSMRGASYLTGRPDAMVVDVGGTTSDIGMLMGGFPRPSGSAVSIGGVLTNFRMPDVLAIGLGGGTLVKDGGQKVGPQSVGWRLPQKGMVFGGDTLTATDIAVATQQADIGDRSLVKAVPSDTLKGALEQMRAMLSRGVDAMKTSAEPLPLIVVGGGGFLVPGDLPGISETLRPNSAGVANAIGAAFAQVGGEADAIYTLSTQSREDALAGAKAKARERASAAGALAGSIKIVDVEETPMSYMAEPGAVIRVKAIGDADLARLTRQSS